MKSKSISKSDRILRILYITLIVLVTILISYQVYIEILEPAYMSYASVCLNVNTEDFGYYQAGNLTQEISEDGNVTLIIEIAPGYSEEVNRQILAHEIIHANQIYRGHKITCRNLFFLEIEAYTFQRLPRGIFDSIYKPLEI
jgi:hypothetical protein